MAQARPYLDYYGENQIIPARQDLGDMRKHFRRRDALYRSLGIAPAWLAGKSVIEFGPGPGDNALFTASSGPELYVFVDGNQASVSSVQARIEAGEFGAKACEIHLSDLIEYRDERRFDLVICEGVIPGQEEPGRYFSHIAEFAKPGGIVAITTISFTSILADVCRRMVKPVFAPECDGYEALVARLVEFFRPDLDSLPGMSRLYEDWVMDQITHPWQANTFTIQEAIDAVGDRFDIHGSMPRFLSDWRWYKSINEERSGFNENAARDYAALTAGFIDYRAEAVPGDPAEGERLERNCRAAFDLHLEIWGEDDLSRLPEFLALVQKIAEQIAEQMPGAAASLRDYDKGMRALAKGDKGADFGSFRSMFGRAQQYVSFLRVR